MGVVGDMAHPGESAEISAPAIDLDRIEPLEMGDVDDLLGLGHAAFGEIDERGAAGEQHGAGLACELPRFSERGGAVVGKILHDAIASFASRTAATICG